MFEDWGPVLQHVSNFGKWDFAFCTHTLEDLRNPLQTAQILPLIAKQGFVSVQSKYAEARRFELNRTYRGYRHHRWIHDLGSEDGADFILAFPKIGTFEHKSVSRLKSSSRDREELWFEWSGSLDYRLFQGDHLGPDDYTFAQNYLSTLLGTSIHFSSMRRRVSALRGWLGQRFLR